MLTFLAEARRGPTRRPLLAFLSQDLRPGPQPARHRDSARSASTGLLCGRGFLWLSSRAFWRPGGWENMCRLLCHCVRHIGLDNKHGRSVKAIHSFLSRWRAGTELCADKQEEPSGKKGSMGSEKRQKSFRSDLKSVVTLLFPPRFDRAARKTRRALAASLRLSCCRAAGSSVFPEDIVEF